MKIFLILPAGYRHVRLRNTSNQPLELSSLFIFSCLEEDASIPGDITVSPVNEHMKEEKIETKKPAKGLLSKFKDVDIGRKEKEVRIVVVVNECAPCLFFVVVQSSLLQIIYDFNYFYVPNLDTVIVL